MCFRFSSANYGSHAARSGCQLAGSRCEVSCKCKVTHIIRNIKTKPQISFEKQIIFIEYQREMVILHNETWRLHNPFSFLHPHTGTRAGLGARLYRAGCTTVQGWVHTRAGLGARLRSAYWKKTGTRREKYRRKVSPDGSKKWKRDNNLVLTIVSLWLNGVLQLSTVKARLRDACQCKNEQ